MSTYDRLLEIAGTLIEKNGFEGFSYSDLAKALDIRKASIHYHFPTKIDLGIAYCETKIASFSVLETHILTLAPGADQLNAYIEAFANCAYERRMCGIYAMLSDSNLFPLELQNVVSQLASHELRILSEILQRGRDSDKLIFISTAADMAIIVCNALKGALLLNRTPPYDAYTRTAVALVLMLKNQQ